MRIFELHQDQTLAAPLERVFAFFSDAANLEAITPPFLKFHIVSPRPIQMKVGTLIDYTLRLHGIKFRWRSRISVWEPGIRFIDEQVRGPYRQWIHEHTFQAVPGGTRVTDHVRYAVPGGALINRLFVRPQLDMIFRHRAAATQRLIVLDHGAS
ncbi:hypothetical protein BH11PLA1_BH11PLA1_12270 [soil metagenome]